MSLRKLRGRRLRADRDWVGPAMETAVPTTLKLYLKITLVPQSSLERGQGPVTLDSCEVTRSTRKAVEEMGRREIRKQRKRFILPVEGTVEASDPPRAIDGRKLQQ